MKEVELAEYIIQNFEDTLTTHEREALIHHRTLTKLGKPGDELSEEQWRERRQGYLNSGLLSSDQVVLQLLSEGYDTFLINIKKRVLRDSPEKIFFRLCPKCERPSRSPHATHCAYCGYVWEE
ncbi:MAG: hypothetical protein AAGA85_09005 [Bacteroidota bacterium]